MPSPSLVESRLADARQQLEALQASVPGFELYGEYQARLHTGSAVASVRFEGDGWGRVTYPLAAPLPAAEAVARHHGLAGNLRYAITGAGAAHVVADFRLNGMAHLPRTFNEIRAGLAAAAGEECLDKTGAGEPLDVAGTLEKRREKLATEIGRLPFGPEDIVRLGRVEDDALWEVRPRVGAEVVPVRLNFMPLGLRLSHAVLRKIPAGQLGAVADQALRYNTARRLCRLTVVGDDLVAETVLHDQLWTAAWLTDAALAVATACRHVREPLEVLARQPRVAQNYLKFMGAS